MFTHQCITLSKLLSREMLPDLMNSKSLAKIKASEILPPSNWINLTLEPTNTSLSRQISLMIPLTVQGKKLKSVSLQHWLLAQTTNADKYHVNKDLNRLCSPEEITLCIRQDSANTTMLIESKQTSENRWPLCMEKLKMPIIVWISLDLVTSLRRTFLSQR
jgi:hypothetical protein